MATGWPMKTTYANGDVYSASDVNDITGTINLLGSSVAYTAGKNKIINGDFGIWQRGTTLSLTTNIGAYLADRFILNWTGTFTGTMSQQTFTPGTAPVSGYEGQFFNRIVRTGTTAAAPTFYQKVENVRTFAGQTATFSFWAKADAARSVGIQAYQFFGTGGSSATDNTVGTASLTTSWQRFTFTYAIPSVSGKTISTSNDSWMTFYLNLPNSTAFTVDIWGMQLEQGSTATAFQTATGTIQGELAACQRYYYRNTGGGAFSGFTWGYATSTTNGYFIIPLPVAMRVNPTSLDFANLQANSSAGNSYACSNGSLNAAYQSTTTGNVEFTLASSPPAATMLRLISANNVNAYIGFSAEL